MYIFRNDHPYVYSIKHSLTVIFPVMLKTKSFTNFMTLWGSCLLSTL